jgi:hypothetical protein
MTTAVPTDLETFLRSNAERARAELFDFLRIPSVSARSEHQADIRRAADLAPFIPEVSGRSRLRRSMSLPRR